MPTASPPVLAVVDDNLMFASRVEAQARRLGFQPRTYSLAAPSAEELAKLRPAVVLVNLTADVWDARELIRRLKAEADTRGLPVAAYAGHKETARLAAGREAGADAAAPNSMVAGNLTAVLAELGVESPAANEPAK